MSKKNFGPNPSQAFSLDEVTNRPYFSNRNGIQIDKFLNYYLAASTRTFTNPPADRKNQREPNLTFKYN